MDDANGTQMNENRRRAKLDVALKCGRKAEATGEEFTPTAVSLRLVRRRPSVESVASTLSGSRSLLASMNEM